MGNLNNKFIDESYGSLLKTTEDTGLSGTNKTTIQDGNGVDTALKLSTENVDVNGDLQTSGTTRVQGDGTLINVSGDISQFTNDSGYLDSLPTNVMVEGENNSLLTNDSGYLTSGTIPSNVMKEGENVSLLTNDAGYLSSIPANVMVEGENNSLLNNDSGYISSIPTTYLESGDNVSELVNDSGYLTSIPTNVMVEGEDVSLLNNDSGYITGVNDGTLQVSGGGAVTNSKFGITDNLNNETGLNIDKANGTLGFENDSSLTANGLLEFRNNSWNVLNTPFGAAGKVGMKFLDVNGAESYRFVQNQYGGVEYVTDKDNQPHIFSNGNITARIDMNSFNNPNNSNNWYQAYLDNINQVNLSGTDLEIIKRDGGVVDTTNLSSLLGVETIVAGTNVTVDNTDPNNPIVNASGGGGGGSAEPGLSATTRGIDMGNGGNNEQWRLTYIPISYGTAAVNVSNNQLKLVALQLTAGQTIRDFSINVTTIGGAGTVQAVLYKADLDANGQLTGGAIEVDFGAISVGTTGQKIITSIGHTLGTTTEDVYFIGIHNKSGGTVGIMAVPSGGSAGPVYHGSLYASTMYRGNTFQSTQSGGTPTTINGITFSKGTDFPIFGIR